MTKPVKWEKDKNIIVKAEYTRKGGMQSFEDQFYFLEGNEFPEKFILWMKNIWENLIMVNPSWNHIWEFMMKLT